ncbi:hypothetical protein ACIBTV_17715 [Micromonospora sp. NPDC049366]|uniref:hypothetical protein n=1 Tax=Micromonospora sp. NPDC049366 TaxID=3364271 RepID=UPI0037965CA0
MAGRAANVGHDDAVTDHAQAEFSPPVVCDQCPHPISEHTLWEPDETCGGWMHCIAPGCDQCWHDWPRLSADEGCKPT